MSAGRTKTHDIKNWKLIFAGVEVDGFGDGSGFSFEPNSTELYSLSVGSDGEHTRSRNHDTSGIVTLTLMASTDAVTQLSALREADELSGTGVYPCSIVHLNGGTSLFAATAYIKNRQSLDISNEMHEIEIQIESGHWESEHFGYFL